MTVAGAATPRGRPTTVSPATTDARAIGFALAVAPARVRVRLVDLQHAQIVRLEMAYEYRRLRCSLSYAVQARAVRVIARAELEISAVARVHLDPGAYWADRLMGDWDARHFHGSQACEQGRRRAAQHVDLERRDDDP